MNFFPGVTWWLCSSEGFVYFASGPFWGCLGFFRACSAEGTWGSSSLGFEKGLLG